MVNKELIEYIMSVRNKGFPDSMIKDHLLKYSYTQAMIDEAFLGLEKDLPKKKSDQEQLSELLNEKKVETNVKSPGEKEVLTNTEQKKRAKNIPFIPVIIVAIVLLVGAFFLYSYNETEQTCKDISIRIQVIDGQEFLCIFKENKKVQAIIENSGKGPISDVQILLKGKTGTNSTKLNSPLETNLLKLIEIDSRIGDLKELYLVPYVKKGDKEFLCSSRKANYSEFKACE